MKREVKPEPRVSEKPLHETYIKSDEDDKSVTNPRVHHDTSTFVHGVPQQKYYAKF